MRIIAGKLKGFSLDMPKDKNTRPLKDMAKESMFNLLKHSNKIALELEKENLRSNVTVKLIALICSDHAKYKRYWHHCDEISATSSSSVALLKDHFFE